VSYCYDTMQKAWDKLSEHLPADVRHGELAVRFGFLISEMHEANHRLKDAINKDDRVHHCARNLDRLMENPNG